MTIFLTPYDNPEDSGKELVIEGVRIQNLLLSGAWAVRPAILSFRLCREIVRYSPDVVHVFKPKGYAGAACTYLLTKGWRGIVLDCDDWEGWGGWNEAKDYPWVVKEFIDCQERYLISAVPAVTVASRVLESRALQLRKPTAQAPFYLPNRGASPEGRLTQARILAKDREELRASFNLPNSPSILYAGHFEPCDDGMFFSRAVMPVARKTGATVLILGDGPELSHVKKFFSSHSDINVRFFGRLPYEEFLKLVAIADVTAYPYPDDPVHHSKCSARIIDYMAMGRPIITTRIGQNTEYIEHRFSGILVPPGDEEQFCEELLVLLNNPTLRARIGANAKRSLERELLSDRTSLEVCLSAYNCVTLSAAQSWPRAVT